MKEMHEVLTELDLGRFCHFCDEQITDTPVEVLGVFDRVEGFAHAACYDNANERAYDRSVEDFYGASSPQTEREREAEEEKRSPR